MTFAEFFTNAHESDLFQQVADEIAKEEKEKVVVDPGFRTDEEWAVLTNQIANQKGASSSGSCDAQAKAVPVKGVDAEKA